MLCDICIGVIERHENELKDLRRDNLRSFGHHRSSSALRAAATSDCYVCSEVWRNFSEGPPNVQRKSSMQDIAFSQPSATITYTAHSDQCNNDEFFTHANFNLGTWRTEFRPNNFNLNVQVGNRGGSSTVNVFYMERLPDDGPDLVPTVPKGNLSQNTLSEQALQHAKDWFFACRQSHPICNNTVSTADWFPTRLLHITELQPGQHHIRLMETVHERASGPYATLSHRWGKGNHLQLTRDTLTVFTEAIPIPALSKTFQEAIFVTAWLGIKFLWIDSLCIMQDKDDLSDWFREASIMDKVYLHSHCNISASVSLDGSQGLSRSRDLTRLYPRTASLLADGFNIDSKHGHVAYKLSNATLWSRNVMYSPINTRGWVFQERLVAPRILHFSYDQLFWECRQTRACETVPEGITFHEKVTDASLAMFRSYFKESAPTAISTSSTHATDAALARARSYRVWQDLIQFYTTTNLTKPLDKLVALSGVAKFMSAITRGSYVAGMWRDNFAQDLLWHKIPDDMNDGYVNENEPIDRATLYRAPTWSWASTSGRVQWVYGEDDEFHIHIVDVFLQHTTEDITGRVKNGWLDLSGRLAPITISLTYNHDRGYDSAWWRIDIDGSSTHTQAEFYVYLDEPNLDAREFDEDNMAGRLFFMLCTTGVEYFQMKAMVFRVVEPSNGVFERLGLGHVLNDDSLEDGEVLRLPIDLDENVKASLPCLRYEDGLHTIRVI